MRTPSLFYSPRFNTGAIPLVSRFFHGSERVVINFFHFVNWSPAVRKCAQFKAERIRPKRLAILSGESPKVYAEMARLTRKSPIHGVFTINMVNFHAKFLRPLRISRSLKRAILPLLNPGGTR
jgi:hypothetical protein